VGYGASGAARAPQPSSTGLGLSLAGGAYYERERAARCTVEARSEWWVTRRVEERNEERGASGAGGRTTVQERGASEREVQGQDAVEERRSSERSEMRRPNKNKRHRNE
jgi:hypothetical protein